VRSQVTKSGYATKKEASDALRQAIATAEAVKSAIPSRQLPAFAEFFETWMTEHAARKCAPKTVERYRELGNYAIRQMVEIGKQAHRFGDVTLDKFGPMQMGL
jgi:hypothetical protein